MVLFLFFIGTVIGSFLGVLIDRLPAGKPVLNSRSVCDSCKKQLTWYELIPIVSYSIQRGKCRKCRAMIPPAILVIELTTGVLFALFYLFLLPQISLLTFIFLLVVLSAMIVIFFADVKFGIIPDQMLIIIMIAALLYYAATNPSALPYYFLWGAILFTFFFILFLITRGGGIGFGDVKFAFVIGFLLGYPGGVLSLYFAFLTGAVISLILILIGRKKFRGDTIAFGPFMIVGIGLYFVIGGYIQSILASLGL